MTHVKIKPTIFIFRILLYILICVSLIGDLVSLPAIIASGFACFFACLWVLFLVKKCALLWQTLGVFFGIGLALLFQFIHYQWGFVFFEQVENQLLFGEIAEVSLFVFGLVSLFYWLTIKNRYFRYLEALLVVGLITFKLISHRELNLHRPRYLSDYSWNIGSHPATLLSLIGVFAFVVSSFFLVQTSKKWRLFVQACLVCGIGFLAYFVTEKQELETKPKDDLLGLLAGNDPRSPWLGRGEGSENENKKDPDGADGEAGSGELEGGGSSKEGQTGSGNTEGESESGGSSQGGQSEVATGEGETGGSSQGDQQDESDGENPQSSSEDPPDSSSGSSEYSEKLPFETSRPQNPQNLALVLVQFYQDYKNPDGYYYFRQKAQSQFNGHRLIEDTSGKYDQDILSANDPNASVKLNREPTENDPHFKLVETDVFVLAEVSNPFGLDATYQIKELTNPNPRYFSKAYKAYSMAPTYSIKDLMAMDLRLPDWSQEKWQHYTAMPDNPRYRKLTLGLIDQIHPRHQENPVAQALTIISFLGTYGVYSLQHDHHSNDDPTASFLFGNRTGYCVHFAHAAVFMARSIGLPARVAGGFLVDQKRISGINLSIHQSDSHAWPEVYFEPLGWVVIDIPYQNSLEDPIPFPTAELQNLLAELVQEEPEDIIEEEIKAKNQINFKRAFAIGGYALAGLAGFILLLHYFYKFWLYKAYVIVDSYPQKALRLLLHHFGMIGLRRKFGESLDRYTQRVAFDDFSKLSKAYLAFRLGGQKQLSLAKTKDLVDAIQSSVNQKASLPRKIIFWINPFTVWFYR